MARAIKHIKAGLLNFEIIGTIPEHEPGRRSGRCRPTSSAQQFYNDKCSWRASRNLRKYEVGVRGDPQRQRDAHRAAGGGGLRAVHGEESVRVRRLRGGAVPAVPGGGFAGI